MPDGFKLKEDKVDEDFTHYIHLSDGRVLKKTHEGVHSDTYVDTDGKTYQVIGVYARITE